MKAGLFAVACVGPVVPISGPLSALNGIACASGIAVGVVLPPMPGSSPPVETPADLWKALDAG